MKKTKRLLSLLLSTMMILSMFAFMFTVNAAEGDEDPEPVVEDKTPTITAEVNYFNETVTISLENYEVDMAEGKTVMYALKAVDKPAKPASEKWYPLYADTGDEGMDINVSAYIPKKADKTYGIALRFSDDILTETGYASRVFVNLTGRPDVKALKGKVTYDITTEQFKNESDSTVELLLGISDFVMMLDKTGSKVTKGEGEDAVVIQTDVVPASIDLFPAGAAFTYRVEANEADSDGKGGMFASLYAKGKVKAQPKAPKMSVAEKKATKDEPAYFYIKGSKDTIEVYAPKTVDGKEVEWQKLPKKDISINELKTLIGAENWADLAIEDKDGKITGYAVTFRTIAAGKKASSAKTTVIIDADKAKAAAPTASFTDVEITAASEEVGIVINVANGTVVEVGGSDKITDYITLELPTGVTFKDNKVEVPEAATQITFSLVVTDTDAIDKVIDGITIKKAKLLDSDGKAIDKDVIATGKITIKVAKATTTETSGT